MRKVIFLLLLLSFISLIKVSAQEIVSKGIVGGLNLSNLYGNDVKNNSIRFGYSLGGFVTIKLNDKLSIRPEIYYCSKGYLSEYKDYSLSGIDEYSVNNKMTLSLNYIEMPIFIVYPIIKNFNIFAGPYIDIFINGETEINSKGYSKFNNGNEVITTNINEDDTHKIKSSMIKSPGFGITIGGEYLYKQFSFGARYSLGLSKTFDASNTSFKHSNIQLMVGFYFP
ncbi:MAG: PorT family protein [Ignavibacteriae bacterium]|nr:PorT family protein [Ignavibacteriota bacterium]